MTKTITKENTPAKGKAKTKAKSNKTLVIVESPTKAKAIGKFLGSNYIVKSSMGHIRDLPKSDLGVDVEHDFTPKYIVIRGKGNILTELKDDAKKAKRVLLAADPDREGEAIAWHLKEYLGPDYVGDNCRVEFNEITKDTIVDAVKHPRAIDMDRVYAQQARRVLDRLVGYKLSPLLWRKVQKGLSAGRVQSAAIGLICDREAEIEAFIPEEYWSLTAHLKGEKGLLDAKLVKIDNKKAAIANEEAMQKVLDNLAGKEYRVTSVQKKKKQQNPTPPFTTSSLQQEAARKLNFPTKKTMQIAQQLYEGIELGKDGVLGLISYMRTDSVRISETAQTGATAYISEKYGKDFVPEKPREYQAKGKIQNAHEAIRPSLVERTPAAVKQYLKNDQYRLYKLIWERFVASQMASAILEVTTVEIAAANYIFRCTGNVVLFPGFMQVYIEGKDETTAEEDDGLLPAINEGQLLELLKLEPKQHFTQPPSRYTEAMLVKALEEKGVGRPSTYAPIIDTILAREYVVRKDKHFYPTPLGRVVVDLLKENFPNIIDVEFTADMEKQLDQVEEGEEQWRDIIAHFYDGFAKTLAEAEANMKEVSLEPEESGEICEKCGRPMVYKRGRFGKFLSCSGYPECKNAKPISAAGDDEKEPEISDEVCEKCGKPMVVKVGRYGKFLACSGYPECKTTKPIVKQVGVKCLACGGNIIQRRSKGGRIFYGCDQYPQCQYVAWDKPIEEKCPVCGTQMTEKTNKEGVTIKLCPNKECPSKKAAPKAKRGRKKASE